MVGITCWQMFSANHTLSATSFEVTQIRKGIYNSQGWSAIDGAEKNEQVFRQEHPDDYKKIAR